jgi:hypothetical protein
MLITDLTNTTWASAATSRHPDDPQRHQQPGHPPRTEMRHTPPHVILAAPGQRRT